MQKICKTCGVSFETPYSKKIYCKSNCKPKKEKITKTCKQCGITFETANDKKIFHNIQCYKDFMEIKGDKERMDPKYKRLLKEKGWKDGVFARELLLPSPALFKHSDANVSYTRIRTSRYANNR